MKEEEEENTSHPTTTPDKLQSTANAIKSTATQNARLSIYIIPPYTTDRSITFSKHEPQNNNYALRGENIVEVINTSEPLLRYTVTHFLESVYIRENSAREPASVGCGESSVIYFIPRVHTENCVSPN